MKALLISLLAAGLAGVGARAGSDPWTSADLVTPEKFAAMVASKGPTPPVYYVGFNVLYRSKHIPGAVYAGPAAKPEGIELLKQALKNVPRDREIVLYCGCCPIDKCPNLRPAFQAARDMGFKKVKALMLPTSFGIDWVEKGFPFE
jgi:thiosulfate/3-mercaptopyruvate sulfurtransferase